MADRTMSEVEVEAVKAAEDRAEETGALSTQLTHRASQSLSEPEKEENKEEVEEGREKTSATSATAAAIVTLEAKRGEKSDFSRVLTLRACERRVAPVHCNRQQACPVFSRLQPASHYYYYYCQRQAVLCVALVALPPPPPPPPPAHRWTGRRRKKLEFGGKMLQMCAQAAAAAAKVVCDLWTRHVASCLPLLLLLRARSAERGEHREDLTYISNEKKRERGTTSTFAALRRMPAKNERERFPNRANFPAYFFKEGEISLN